MNLKRILLFMPLLALTTANYCAQPPYVPTAGPIPLADGAQQGAITATLIHNRSFASEKAKIIQFLPGMLPPNAQLPHYQRVIDLIIPAQAPEALSALEAYASVIMHIYQEKAYLIKAGVLPHLCPIRGIRSPLSNEAQLNQLLDEYDQLATIALEKSALVGSRMKANVKAYKYWYWKTATAIVATAYVFYDLKTRGAKDGLIANLIHCNFGKIFTNLKTDLGFNVTIPDFKAGKNDPLAAQILKLEQQKAALLSGKKLPAQKNNGSKDEFTAMIEDFIKSENTAIEQLQKAKDAKIAVAFEHEKKKMAEDALKKAITDHSNSWKNLTLEQQQALKEFEAYKKSNSHLFPKKQSPKQEQTPFEKAQNWLNNFFNSLLVAGSKMI